MVYAGIDVGKERLDLALLVWPEGRSRGKSRGGSKGKPEGKPEGKVTLHRFPNSEQGRAALVRLLTRQQPSLGLVALESSGVYHLPLLQRLVASCIPVALANPYQVAAFRKASGVRNKTDSQDASLLAKYALAYEGRLGRRLPPPARLARLKRLLVYREQLIKRATMVRGSLEAAGWMAAAPVQEVGVARSNGRAGRAGRARRMTADGTGGIGIDGTGGVSVDGTGGVGGVGVSVDRAEQVGEDEAGGVSKDGAGWVSKDGMAADADQVLSWLEEDLRFLRERLHEVEQAIGRILSLLPEAGVLQEQKGVGPQVAAAVLAYLPPELWDSPKRAASFSGLIPEQQHSGSSIRRSRLSRKGPALLRKKLYLAALVAVKHDPEMKAFYLRLLSRGKKRKQALLAVAHKLLRRLTGRLKAYYREQGQRQEDGRSLKRRPGQNQDTGRDPNHEPIASLDNERGREPGRGQSRHYGPNWAAETTRNVTGDRAGA